MCKLCFCAVQSQNSRAPVAVRTVCSGERGRTTLRTCPCPHPRQPAEVRGCLVGARRLTPLLPCCPATSRLDTVGKRKTNKAHDCTHLLPGCCKSPFPWWQQAAIVCTVRLWIKSYSQFLLWGKCSFISPCCFLCSE